jgi:hypothetical protein
MSQNDREKKTCFKVLWTWTKNLRSKWTGPDSEQQKVNKQVTRAVRGTSSLSICAEEFKARQRSLSTWHIGMRNVILLLLDVQYILCFTYGYRHQYKPRQCCHLSFTDTQTLFARRTQILFACLHAPGPPDRRIRHPGKLRCQDATASRAQDACSRRSCRNNTVASTSRVLGSMPSSFEMHADFSLSEFFCEIIIVYHVRSFVY